MKKDKRGSYWKEISLEERTKRMSALVSKRWARTTKAERKEYSDMMNKLKKKKLSTLHKKS